MPPRPPSATHSPTRRRRRGHRARRAPSPRRDPRPARRVRHRRPRRCTRQRRTPCPSSPGSAAASAPPAPPATTRPSTSNASSTPSTGAARLSETTSRASLHERTPDDHPDGAPGHGYLKKSVITERTRVRSALLEQEGGVVAELEALHARVGWGPCLGCDHDGAVDRGVLRGRPDDRTRKDGGFGRH